MIPIIAENFKRFLEEHTTTIKQVNMIIEAITTTKGLFNSEATREIYLTILMDTRRKLYKMLELMQPIAEMIDNDKPKGGNKL